MKHDKAARKKTIADGTCDVSQRVRVTPLTQVTITSLTAPCAQTVGVACHSHTSHLCHLYTHLEHIYKNSSQQNVDVINAVSTNANTLTALHVLVVLGAAMSATVRRGV
jgi:hypothetical protein